MKIEKVNYQKSFPYAPFLQEKIGFEIILEEGDDPLQKLAEAKKMAEDFFNTSNPHVGMVHTIEQVPDITISKDSKENSTNRMLEAINTCTSKEVLQTFKLLVEKNPIFKEAYDNKLKSFT